MTYPTLSSLKERSEILPKSPFRYHWGAFTGGIVFYYPNAYKGAQDLIRLLENQSGNREYWEQYLELLELIVEYERKIFKP